MDALIFIAIFAGGIIGLVAILFLIANYLSNRRIGAIITQGTLLGFSALPVKGFNPRSLAPSLLLLERTRVMDNLLLQRVTGGGEQSQYIFDIELRGGEAQHEKMTVCLQQLKELQIPPFMLKGRDKTRFTTRFLHDLTRMTQSWLHHYRPVQIDAPDDFNNHYELLAPAGGREIKRHFTTRLLRLLETHPGWQMEGAGEWLFLYRRGELVKAHQLVGFVTECQVLGQGFLKNS
ncbi:MAG: hypothetical protein ABW146_10240 [Candidatus Sedimenticola sp. 6PFRAG7]